MDNKEISISFQKLITALKNINCSDDILSKIEESFFNILFQKAGDEVGLKLTGEQKKRFEELLQKPETSIKEANDYYQSLNLGLDSEILFNSSYKYALRETLRNLRNYLSQDQLHKFQAVLI